MFNRRTTRRSGRVLRYVGASLCILAGLAAYLRSAAPPTLSRDAAIERVEQLQGKVRIDGEKADLPVWSVELADTAVTDEDLSLLAAFPALEVLDLSQTAITDGGLAPIGALQKLRELNLSGTKITDAGLARIAACRELRVLGLNQTAVTERGLAALTGLKNLKAPEVFDTVVTDEAIRRWEAARDAAPEAAPPASTTDDVPPTDAALTQRLAAGMHQLARTSLVASAGDPEAVRRSVELLEQALEADPENDLLRVDLADGLALLDDDLARAAATDLYEDALSRSPHDDRLLARLARTYAALENAPDAFRFARARLQDVKQPDRVLEVALQLAAIAATTEEPEQGARILAELSLQYPDYPWLRLIQAMLLVETDRDEARRVLQPLRERFPPPHPYGVEAERLTAAPEDVR